MSAVDDLRLPRAFVDDHISRCLPAPDFVRESARFVWVRADDQWLAELYNDAAHYETMDSGNDDPGTNALNRPVAAAARRLLKALRAAGWTKEKARKLYPRKAMKAWEKASR